MIRLYLSTSCKTRLYLVHVRLHRPELQYAPLRVNPWTDVLRLLATTKREESEFVVKDFGREWCNVLWGDILLKFGLGDNDSPGAPRTERAFLHADFSYGNHYGVSNNVQSALFWRTSSIYNPSAEEGLFGPAKVAPRGA